MIYVDRQTQSAGQKNSQLLFLASFVLFSSQILECNIKLLFQPEKINIVHKASLLIKLLLRQGNQCFAPFNYLADKCFATKSPVFCCIIFINSNFFSWFEYPIHKIQQLLCRKKTKLSRHFKLRYTTTN